MSPELQLQALEEALSRLQVVIREEEPPGDSAGGLCVIRGAPTLILRPFLRPVDQIAVMAKALGRLGTEGIWLPPIVRRRVEENSLYPKAPRLG